MQKVTVLFVLLFLVSCKSLKGDFSANDHLTFNYKGKKMVVKEGDYKAELKFKSKKKLELKLKNARANGKTAKIKMTIPKGTQLPQHNGEIELSAEQLGQPYDLVGKVQTTVSNGGLQTGYESCTYSTYEYVCREVCGPKKCVKAENGTVHCRRPQCSTECGNDTVYHNGSQYIEYYNSHSTTQFLYELLHADSDQVAGVFKTSTSKSYRTVTNRGSCN